MARSRSELSTLIAETVDKMLAEHGNCSISELTEEILGSENGIMDSEAERWKRESIGRRVKAYLKKKSSWVTSHQLTLPDVVIEQPLPSAINVPQSILVDQEGTDEKIEVIENKWIPVEKATLAELKKYRLMLRNSMLADGRKMTELEVWIDYLENNTAGEEDVTVETVIAAISEQVA